MSIFSLLFPSLIWRFKEREKIIYLTFDDGPIPEVTPWVLDLLKEFNAKATFFSVGDNAKKHPALLKKIISSGHSIGNHTMNHLNGWKTPDEKYFSNVSECSRFVNSKLFRPPYGRIKFSQIRKLKKDFRIIMWDVLSRDYDSTLTGEQCFENVKSKAKPGSIIVFHDSIKAESRLRHALPETLKYFSDLGYKFQTI
jgi:peptidoglycan/xylan/chitin deacetylase (PgdA/CDA1 family)